MFVLTAYSGIRRSELCRSQIKDFDFEGGQLKVRERKRRKDVGQTFRFVPIHSTLRRVMQAWFEDQHPGGGYTIAKIDGTILRAHRCAAGGEQEDLDEPDDHALGCSRAGFATKLHLLVTSSGNPLGFHLTAGQVHDSTVLDSVTMTANELTDMDGNPIAWPVALGGDKGYRADWIDQYLLDLGIQPVIPSKENENRETRPVEFDRDIASEISSSA